MRAQEDAMAGSEQRTKDVAEKREAPTPYRSASQSRANTTSSPSEWFGL
jgi:hypothetical protein